jgi:hypothetical protein
VFQSRDCENKAFRGQFVEVWRLARHDALEIDPEPEVVTHGNEDIGLLLLLRGCGRARHRNPTSQAFLIVLMVRLLLVKLPEGGRVRALWRCAPGAHMRSLRIHCKRFCSSMRPYKGIFRIT